MERKINLPKPLFAQHGPRAVLLLHAYSGSPNDVRMMSRYLEKLNYTVYSPMFSGHGTLDPQDILHESPEQWWQDTQAAISKLKAAGYQEIAVFGLSMGGIFAMRLLTEADPSIIGGGLFCSPIFPKKETHVPENFLLYSEEVLKVAQVPDADQRLAEIKAAQPAQLKAINQQAALAAAKLATVKVPVFLAQAGQDEMINASGVFETAEALIQTDYQLNWYPNSTHVITVGVDRKKLERDVAAFLAGLPWNEEMK